MALIQDKYDATGFYARKSAAGMYTDILVMNRGSIPGFIAMVVYLAAVMNVFFDRREIYPEVSNSKHYQIECYISISP